MRKKREEEATAMRELDILRSKANNLYEMAMDNYRFARDKMREDTYQDVQASTIGKEYDRIA